MCVLTPPTRTGFQAVNDFQGGNHEKSKQKKAGRDRARLGARWRPTSRGALAGPTISQTFTDPDTGQIDSLGIESNCKLLNTKAAGYNRALNSIARKPALMTINLSGLLLPVITPFTAGEDIDADGLAANLEKWNGTGVIGYVVLGSTGERVNLDEREYLQVIDTARQAVPQTLSFIAGAGQQSTLGTIKEMHRNIIGIKDSSADLAELAETVRLVRRGVAVLIGNGTVLCEALQAGAGGAILAVGCVVPQLCLEIYEAVRENDIERAVALQERLTPLARAVTKTYGIGGLKAAMEMAGFVGGAVRSPLERPSEEASVEIESLLRKAIDACSEVAFTKASEPRP